MPLQNRVTPLSQLVATPQRGLVYGNRGSLHDAERKIRRSYNGKRWIARRLEFRGRRRQRLMQPGRYTELFFLDDATALAAGHRPCAECRREDYARFTALWRDLHPGQVGADAIDSQLHGERIVPGTRVQRHHEAAFDELPDGVFVVHQGEPFLVLGRELLQWTPGGYHRGRRRPARGRAVLITPPSLLSVLRTDWQPVVPLLHPSAMRISAPSR